MSATSEMLTPAMAGESYPATDFQYRPLHSAAVASLLLALLSGTVFVAGRDSLQAAMMLSPIPLAGLAVGLRSLRKIKYSDGQLSGGRIALLGTLGSACCLVGGLGFAGFVFATELPEGYARTAFADLRPDEVEMRGNQAVPEDVLALDGKPIFIKGYIRPDSTPVRNNIKRFLLVRDSNNCCFGDLSTVKYYDQIDVKVADQLKIDYRTGVFRVGGILRVEPANVHSSVPGLVYSLDADYAK